MKKVIRIVFSGVCGIGMADGLRSIYRTNPPVSIPDILTNSEAAYEDADALAGDWQTVAADISSAYHRRMEVEHV